MTESNFTHKFKTQDPFPHTEEYDHIVRMRELRAAGLPYHEEPGVDEEEDEP